MPTGYPPQYLPDDSFIARLSRFLDDMGTTAYDTGKVMRQNEQLDQTAYHQQLQDLLGYQESQRKQSEFDQSLEEKKRAALEREAQGREGQRLKKALPGLFAPVKETQMPNVERAETELPTQTQRAPTPYEILQRGGEANLGLSDIVKASDEYRKLGPQAPKVHVVDKSLVDEEGNVIYGGGKEKLDPSKTTPEYLALVALGHVQDPNLTQQGARDAYNQIMKDRGAISAFNQFAAHKADVTPDAQPPSIGIGPRSPISAPVGGGLRIGGGPSTGAVPPGAAGLNAQPNTIAGQRAFQRQAAEAAAPQPPSAQERAQDTSANAGLDSIARIKELRQQHPDLVGGMLGYKGRINAGKLQANTAPEGYAEFAAEVKNLRAQITHQLAGTAIGPAEKELYFAAIPNTDQSDQQFDANLEVTQRNLQRLMRWRADALARGLDLSKVAPPGAEGARSTPGSAPKVGSTPPPGFHR